MAAFNSEAFVQRWRMLSLAEQMGNIGSEFDRIVSWKKKNNADFAARALDRTLELLDMTIGDPRWSGPRRRELTRTREILCDALVGDNTYNTPLEFLSAYFYQFAVAARAGR